MRKLVSILPAVALTMSVSAVAQETTLATTLSNLQLKAIPQASVADIRQAYINEAELSVLPAEGTKLAESNGASVKKAALTRKAVKKAAPTSTAALAGNYVTTYSSLVSSGTTGGSSSTITADESGDSITITSFWGGFPVRAHVDTTTGAVTIPKQVVGTNSTYGDLYIAVCSSSGTPDKTSQIVGTVDANGNFSFSSWWGIFTVSASTSGTTTVKADALFTANYNTVIAPANATMTYTYTSPSTSASSTRSFPIRVEQTSKNVLTVTNLFNYGHEIEINLNRDRSAAMESQIVVSDSNGDWYTYKGTFDDETNKISSYSAQISIPAAAEGDNRNLSWTDWTLIVTTTSGKTYMGRLTNTTINTSFDIEYPSLSVSDFEGEGTEANPYKISTLDHLILLADKVNNDTIYEGGSGSFAFTKTYKGKVFELTNDIDMTGYRFDPIGAYYNQRFAGTFDGKGHTIKGLTVNVTSGYAGLFGIADSTAVFKNIVFESPSVQSARTYAAPLVAYNYGSIDNITVNSPYVYNASGYGAGGVASIVIGDVTNCVVNGGTIGAAGYVGGVVSEAHSTMAYCGANDTKVYAWGEGYPAGGVVGNLVYGHGDHLWFKGLLSYDSGVGGQYLGGIAGFIGAATLTNSFASGLVRGYGSSDYVGGLAGRLKGNIENCYSTGRVYCYSRMTGGLVGLVDTYQTSSDGVTAETHQSSIRNSYTATSVQAETYQYDRTECREVIGKITSDTNPTIENLYFDKQMTNFYSDKYGTLGSNLTKAAGPDGFNAADWVYEEGAYPRIKGLETLEASLYSASAFNFVSGDNTSKVSNNTPVKLLGNTKLYFYKGGKLDTTGYYCSLENDTLKIGTEFGTDTIYVVNGNTSTYHFVKVAPIPFEGDGTVESPFLIKTKADLIALSEATTQKAQTFEQTYFSIENDIDVEYDEAFKGIACDRMTSTDNNGTVTYTTVYAKEFQGIINGNGHTLHRMIFSGAAWTKKPTATELGDLVTKQSNGQTSFVGRLGVDGVVRNLNVAADCDFTNLYASSGGIVGNCAGTVENCRNYADLIAASCWVGGIVGQGTKTAVIRNCYNAGNITSNYSNAGGIIGNSYGVIENCVNTGDITVKIATTSAYSKQLHHAAGIAGGSYGSTIKNCANYGTVYAAAKNAGGITGSTSGSTTAGVNTECKITNCISIGSVDTEDKTLLGAIGGQSGTNGGADTYWDAQIIDLKANGNSDATGMIGAETSVLTSGTALENYDTEIWDFTAGVYPTLKAFADEPKVVAARKVILSIPSGSTVGDLRVDATLGTGATWTIANGTKGFAIEGNTLKAPSTVNSVVNDTIYATNEVGVVKPIYLAALPQNPLTGKGTEAEPYLITSTDDWNALADFTDNTGDDLNGKFVKITNDLEFSDSIPAKRFSTDGVTLFAGTLDGDNHVVSGIKLESAVAGNGAIFRYINADGTVKNITFRGEASFTKANMAAVVDNLYGTLDNVVNEINVTSTGSYTAGVVSKAYEGATLNKVVNRGKISSTATYAAGVVANSVAGVTYKNCGNEGAVSYEGSLTKATAVYLGGFAAALYSATLDSCYNSGEVTAPAFATTVAGLAAYVPGAAAAQTYTITNCWNSGNVTAGAKLAGVISTTTTNAHITMTDCYNTGDIYSAATAAISSTAAAGIISYYAPASTFTRCYNTGSIVNDKSTYAAGIGGAQIAAPTATTPTKFVNCYNTGDIIATGNQGGGILGYISAYTTVDSCYNTGNIEGTQMVGGIASAIGGASSKVSNCYNTGNVTASEYRAGGIVAWGAGTNATIDNCWNSGNVASTNTVVNTIAKSGNSIGGIAGTTAAVITNCYSTGKITGTARVGGIVGFPSKGKTVVRNSYFAGTLNCAAADSCGAIVGVATVNNSSVWATGNEIDSCYYTDNSSKLDSVGDRGTAVSRAELCKLKLNGYVSVDDYTMPVLEGFADNTTAVFNAAELVLADNDQATGVATTAFNVGAPDVVTWTSDCENLSISGNDAIFTSPYSGTIKVTATAGDLTKTYTVTANCTSSISDIESDAEVVDTIYYNLAGVVVPRPTTHDGQVYIVVLKYADNTTKVVKLLNK
jgi:hypothetical protein